MPQRRNKTDMVISIIIIPVWSRILIAIVISALMNVISISSTIIVNRIPILIWGKILMVIIKKMLSNCMSSIHILLMLGSINSKGSHWVSLKMSAILLKLLWELLITKTKMLIILRQYYPLRAVRKIWTVLLM